MKFITNEKLIKRNSQAGYWASLLSPVTLVLSAILLEQKVGLSWLIFSLGVILYQIGKLLRKYGRGADLTLNKALERLGNEYTLYHFSTPVSHLLVGPAGVWMLVPRYVQGEITYNAKRNRWKLVRKGPFAKLTGFLREGLGRPDLEIINEATALDRYLEKRWEGDAALQVDAALIVMDEKSIIDAGDSPVPTIHLRSLRQFLREKEKENKIPPTTLKKLIQILPRD